MNPGEPIAEHDAACSLQAAGKIVFSLSPACTSDVVFLSRCHRHIAAMLRSCCRPPGPRIACTGSMDTTGKRHRRRTGHAHAPRLQRTHTRAKSLIARPWRRAGESHNRERPNSRASGVYGRRLLTESSECGLGRGLPPISARLRRMRGVTDDANHPCCDRAGVGDLIPAGLVIVRRVVLAMCA
jgi:hypothetical protein